MWLQFKLLTSYIKRSTENWLYLCLWISSLRTTNSERHLCGDAVTELVKEFLRLVAHSNGRCRLSLDTSPPITIFRVRGSQSTLLYPIRIRFDIVLPCMPVYLVSCLKFSSFDQDFVRISHISNDSYMLVPEPYRLYNKITTLLHFFLS